MSNFINDELENLINDLEGLPSRLPLEDKIKNNDFSKEMININKLYEKIINNSEYLKCILVLGLKKITWKNELRDKFDIGIRTIEYFIYNMKSNGMILTKTLTDLDDVLYETLLRLNNKSFYQQSQNINLLALTTEGEEFFKKLLEDCVKLQRQDITSTIMEINNKTKAFKQVYNDILELENKTNYSRGETKIIEGYRYIKYPDGTLIMKETEKSKQKRIKIRQAILESKKEILLEKQKKGLLSNKQSDSIVLLSNNQTDLVVYNEDVNKEEKTIYNGLYSHLNNMELDNIINGVTREEEKEAEKKHKEDIKYRNKVLNDINDKDYYNKILNITDETYEEELKRKRECNIFLNSLIAYD